MDGIVFKYGIENADLHRAAEMLATAYWSPGISYEDVESGFSNSTAVVSVYDGARQIGCCRAISDKTRYAYIMDVFIDESYRHRGIGQRMLRFMLDCPGLENVRSWNLITRDAHKFYEKLGFAPHSRPNDMLEIKKKT